MRVTGWRCAVCDATVAIATPFPWRCPNSTDDDRHHVLTIVNGGPPAPGRSPGEPSLLAHDRDLAWAAYADANGFDHTARAELVEQSDAVVVLSLLQQEDSPFEIGASLLADMHFLGDLEAALVPDLGLPGTQSRRGGAGG